MDEKKREEIAVFRYGVIAAVLYGGTERQSEYFARLAQTRLEAPHRGPRLYSVPTFKSWLRKYRRHGLEGLKPKSRSDCGRPRAVSEALSQAIAQILAAHPRMGVPQLHQRLVRQGLINSRSPSPATLRRHIAQAGLRPPGPEPKGRKPFEKPNANDMWTIDFMHGPKLPRSGRRRDAFWPPAASRAWTASTTASASGSSRTTTARSIPPPASAPWTATCALWPAADGRRPPARSWNGSFTGS